MCIRDSAKDSEGLRELKIELIDRFGLLPPQTERLFDVMRLRLRAEMLGIERLELGAGGGRIIFANEPDVDPMALIQLIQRDSDIYRFDGKKVLRIVKAFENIGDGQEFMDQLLDQLTVREAA